MRTGDPAAKTRELAAYLAARGQLVETALQDALPTAEVIPAPLHAAMLYSVFAGGKRVRPLLVLASAEAVGERPDAVLPTACAVEL
ncbi:MAG: polyprenyl synthetase family protein, partial [Armatimonadota bacterium]